MDRVTVNKQSDKSGKESVSYRKEWDKNGIHHSLEVKKVTGGYIITKSKYGKPKDDPEADYVDERTEEVSTTNPLKSEEDEKMFGFIDRPELL